MKVIKRTDYNYSEVADAIKDTVAKYSGMTKTQVNKALIQRESIQLDLKNQQTQLYSTIENYWLQATTNQSQFKAAKVSSESAQTSYNLLSEQFKLGLKNIVELRTGKDNLLKAKQNELQAKYLAILNINMLKFLNSPSLTKFYYFELN